MVVHVSDDYAYVASQESGLLIIDVSDPSNPVEVDFIKGIVASGAYVSGSYVYVADQDYGFVILRKREAFRLCLPLVLRSN